MDEKARFDILGRLTSDFQHDKIIMHICAGMRFSPYKNGRIIHGMGYNQ